MGELGNSANLLMLLIVAQGAYMLAKLVGIDLGWPYFRDIRKPKSLLTRLVELFIRVSPLENYGRRVQRIYSFGHEDPLRDGDTFVFQSKIGLRLGYPVVAAVLLYFLLDGGIPSLIDLASFIVICAGLVTIGFYVWSFRVEMEGHQLRIMDMLFRMKTYDLADLKRVDDFNDSYRLHFRGAGNMTIPRYVEGHEDLREILIKTLDINGH